jgi:TetR/AcrR family transcriptional repressor of the ameABC operon
MSTAKSKHGTSSKTAILDAAESLFAERGYRDTTVAEIATSAGMSPANLYRHFENKEDIAAGCCYRHIEKKNQLMREVLEKKRLTAAERLEELIIALLRYTHEQTQEKPNLNQTIEVVIQSRPEVVHDMLSGIQSIIAEILAQGNAQKEFAVENVMAASETVFAAIVAFYTPLFMNLYPLPEFERRARAMAELLVRGLARR